METPYAEIEEGNMLIAKFMGGVAKDHYLWHVKVKQNKKPYYIGTPRLKYHKDWNWLMPVMEKIGKDRTCRIAWQINCDEATFIYKPNGYESHIDFGGMGPLMNTWKAVVAFIKWYNETYVDYTLEKNNQKLIG